MLWEKMLHVCLFLVLFGWMIGFFQVVSWLHPIQGAVIPSEGGCGSELTWEAAKDAHENDKKYNKKNNIFFLCLICSLQLLGH